MRMRGCCLEGGLERPLDSPPHGTRPRTFPHCASHLRISSLRPTTGSSPPWRASCVRSREYLDIAVSCGGISSCTVAWSSRQACAL